MVPVMVIGVGINVIKYPLSFPFRLFQFYLFILYFTSVDDSIRDF